jgi:hypothetical protein
MLGKRTFDLLRPYWVKRMKDRNVCCCIYHVEMEELRVGFNHMRQKFGLHLEIHCQCEAICGAINDSPTSCGGSHATYLGLTTLWEIVIYLKAPHS